MDTLQFLFSYYDNIVKTNPALAVLLVPAVGGLMYALKGIPKTLWGFLVRHTTTTMTLNNTGWGGNPDAFNMFDTWFMSTGWNRFSKNFFLTRRQRHELTEGEEYKPYRLGTGDGFHFFFYRGRPFWFRKLKLDSAGSENQKQEIRVSTIGFSMDSFSSLTTLFNEMKKKTDVSIYEFSQRDSCWLEKTTLIPRRIDTFAMNKEQLDDIINRIEEFIERRAWYQSKGLTHKLTFLFTGPPGTGKTTLVRILSTYFKRDLNVLDLSAQNDRSLANALASIKPGSFLLMEDIDQAGDAVRDRNLKKEESLSFTSAEPLTMSGVLNALDGVVGLDNIVIFKTTNHPEHLDPALLRKSRVDEQIYIPELSVPEIIKYAAFMYSDTTGSIKAGLTKKFEGHNFTMAGCDVENSFKENPDNHLEFADMVIERARIRVAKLHVA